MVLLSSASVVGAATLINAGDHICSQIAEIIRQQKDVFGRIGFGGRSFRYPAARCDLGESATRPVCEMPAESNAC